MRNRLYGGVRGRKMKVGGNYFIFLLLDCCGGRTRTCDLQVMSLASYQLLHSAILSSFP